MNKVIILLALAAVAYAVPSPSLRTLPALRHEEVHDKYGQFAFRYFTAEGTLVEQRGYLVRSASGGLVLIIEGSVTYTGPDGKVYRTTYSAGPDGYKVLGDHLPVAPIAPAII